jgi:hypothetical protein
LPSLPGFFRSPLSPLKLAPAPDIASSVDELPCVSTRDELYGREFSLGIRFCWRTLAKVHMTLSKSHRRQLLTKAELPKMPFSGNYDANLGSPVGRIVSG